MLNLLTPFYKLTLSASAALLSILFYDTKKIGQYDAISCYIYVLHFVSLICMQGGGESIAETSLSPFLLLFHVCRLIQAGAIHDFLSLRPLRKPPHSR